MKKLVLGLMALVISTQSAFAGSYENLAVGAAGYDVVAYFTEGKAKVGNSNHVVYDDGLAYYFETRENANLFKEKPGKYKPAYNGYCAMGVSKGKKFPVDPEAWRIVDGRLYLNLNKTVQKAWLEDMEGNISEANEIWEDIKDIHPNKL